MSKNKDWAFYFEELQSNGCICGGPKKPGYSFCYKCYSKLSREKKKDLYRRIGDGYEEAYEAAVQFLHG